MSKNKEIIKEELRNTITSYIDEDQLENRLGGKEELDKMIEDILSIFVEHEE